MKIKRKGKLAQFFCKHEFVEGVVSDPSKPIFFNLSGETITTICKKCGKIKGARFAPNFDGS